MPREEEFELVPISPLRRLEKRIEKLESSMKFDTKEIWRELVNVVRINQQIVSELVKANDALRIELSKLPAKIEELVKKLDELLSYIRAAGEEVSQPEYPLVERIEEIAKMNKQISEKMESIIAALDEIERRMRTRIVLRKPLIKPRPKV